eukprot:1162829-Prorocentrum_minimum.AAC.1
MQGHRGELRGAGGRRGFLALVVQAGDAVDDAPVGSVREVVDVQEGHPEAHHAHQHQQHPQVRDAEGEQPLLPLLEARSEWEQLVTLAHVAVSPGSLCVGSPSIPALATCACELRGHTLCMDK